jgi:hypothetical protein
VQRTRPKGRPEGRTSRQSRGSGGQTQATRRFARSAGQTARGRRFREPEQSGAQKVMQGIRGVLPGGGKSSAKRGKGSRASIPVVGGLLTSLGRKKGRGAGRGRKSAMVGVLGAGAAGAAAAAAKRRSRSSRAQADASGTSEAQTAPTATSPAGDRSDARAPSEAPGVDTPPAEETSDPPDGPAGEDQRD